MHFLKGAGGGGFLRSFYQTSFFLVLMKVSLIFIVVLNLGSSSFISIHVCSVIYVYMAQLAGYEPTRA